MSIVRLRNLPSKWDGNRVEWLSDWRMSPAFVCPPPKRRDPCSTCGSTRPRLWRFGAVYSPPIATQRRARSYGDLVVNQLEARDGRIVGNLFVQRCSECGHDQVWERSGDDEGAWWDLEDSDYSNEGSCSE